MRLVIGIVTLAGSLSAQLGPNALMPDWLPTELPADAAYAGSRSCIECHAQQASALRTAMGDALQRAADSPFLRENDELTYAIGPYRYRIRRTQDGSLYSVTDGDETIFAPILWSFGHGKAGQTYVFDRGGQLYESRVSYYEAIKGLDQTLGAPPGEIPRNLEEAAGRKMTPDDGRGCFGCHATGAVRGGKLTLDQLTPGVQCEGCHGPGVDHIAAVKAAEFDDLRLPKLSGMPAEQESDFCGACHRTWSDVMLMGLQGPANVRFQPYRLANSRCYDASDPRIRCSACHDPHTEPERGAKKYDRYCQNCHAAPGAATCTVGTEACSDCHMPKVEIPGSHFEFTDHQIRIWTSGSSYPN